MSPGAGGAGGCDLYSVAGDRTWVFWKNSKHSSGVSSLQPLEAISAPGALEPMEQQLLFMNLFHLRSVGLSESIQYPPCLAFFTHSGR